MAIILTLLCICLHCRSLVLLELYAPSREENEAWRENVPGERSHRNPCGLVGRERILCFNLAVACKLQANFILTYNFSVKPWNILQERRLLLKFVIVKLNKNNPSSNCWQPECRPRIVFTSLSISFESVLDVLSEKWDSFLTVFPLILFNFMYYFYI